MPISRRCSYNQHPLYLQTYGSSVTRTVIRFPCTVDIGYSDVLDIARLLALSMFPRLHDNPHIIYWVCDNLAQKMYATALSLYPI